ncbi:hypothetical protein BV20DRAFT_827910 [Pilatotrama ljubarskyi]|nr:hypothetical protein BV20DRAFT_827910 [Pilatotrama ljubarskyi]
MACGHGAATLSIKLSRVPARSRAAKARSVWKPRGEALLWIEGAEAGDVAGAIVHSYGTQEGSHHAARTNIQGARDARESRDRKREITPRTTYDMADVTSLSSRTRARATKAVVGLDAACKLTGGANWIRCNLHYQEVQTRCSVEAQSARFPS